VKGKKCKVVPVRSTEVHLGERMYSSYSFLTSALEGGEWSASGPSRVLPPSTHCIGGWVGPRASLDAEVRGKILCLSRGSNPSRPVRSQTLHWLSYPGSWLMYCHTGHVSLLWKLPGIKIQPTALLPRFKYPIPVP
jgi:hypothetical protein